MNDTLAYMMALLARDNIINLTKLNKLLFFCDIIFYIKNGYKESISEEEYLKLPYGPVAVNANDTRYNLISRDILKESINNNISYTEYLYKTNDNLYFDRIENALEEKKSGANEVVESVINNLIHFNAKELSEISHKYEPWKSVNSWGETLNFINVKEDKDFLMWCEKENLLTNM